MEYISDNEIPVKQEEESLFRLLDRGIDDMEAGRELSIDEAFQRVDELRERHRRARAYSYFNMGNKKVVLRDVITC